MRARLLFLATALVFAACPPAALAVPAFAESVNVEARAVPTKATVGDEIKLFLRVEHPKAYAVKPPSDKLPVAPFEVKRVEVAPYAEGKNRVIDTFVVTLTTFTTGDAAIPSFPVEYTDGSGRPGRAMTEPVPVKVASVAGKLTGKEDIKPIKGPVSLGFAAFRDVLLAAAAVALTIALAFSIVLRVRRRPKVDPETLLPPHERAFLELGRLDSKAWLDAGDLKAHYGELGDVLRRYLSRRFGVDAPELTTPETIARLKAKELPRETIERVREVLETADLVKFAKHAPPRAAAVRARTALVEAVEATKPVEAAPAPKEPAKP